MKDIKLLGKRVIFDKSPVILKYTPDENWQQLWDAKTGEWKVQNGAFIGIENGNMGGILLTKEHFDKNVMLSFNVRAIPPATRDLNAVFCTHWNDETNYIYDSYVCGLNGWYDHKSGIERSVGDKTTVYSTTSLYKYEPGTTVRLTCGAIDGHCFMVVDDELVTELIDVENPLHSGKVGFSAYCTMLEISDIEIREIYWENITQSYQPEF